MLNSLLSFLYWLGLIGGSVALLIYFLSYLKIRKQLQEEEKNEDKR